MAPTRVMKAFETEKVAKTQRPKHRKGRLSQRSKVVREVVREVAGLVPYEKRILDMIKSQFKTVILISHLDSLKDVVDMTIDIDKVGGYAKVNI